MSADARLNDLLVRWQELRDQGKPATVEEICRDCPQLVDSLKRKIEVAQAVGALFGGECQTVGPEKTVPGTPRPRDWPEVPGYEIVRELGRGGMGIVYLARQLGLGRLVALKMILTPQARAEERDRFRAEVEAVARLQHPNLVHVYEVGEHGGRPYFSMEYVDGSNLADKIDGDPQPTRQSAELVEVLARAMGSVHRQGIIHRDLKPANVLLSGDGVPKVTDFGLAKRIDSAGVTASGAVLGTPSYMAPEQAAGKSKLIGPATDIYALGAILYEMLTGRPPFDAETAWDTVVQVISEDPVPPRRLRPKVPPDLETICLHCLNKEPGRRYASALALADDLRHFLDGEPIAARPIGPVGRAVKWARRRPAAAGLLVVSALALLTLTIGALVYSALVRSALAEARANAEESRQRLVGLCVGRGTRLLDEDDAYGALLWFTEALQLDEGDADSVRMHRARIAATLRTCPRLVQHWAHDGPVLQVEFSPDGGRVLTTSEDRTARVWDVATGKPATTPLVHQGSVVDGDFSHDGKLVLTTSADGTARLWSAETGKSLLPPLVHDKPLIASAFSPDDQRIATACEDGMARLWDRGTGKQIGPPLVHQGRVEWVAFSPDGRQVVTASDDQTARVWDVATGMPASPPLRHRGPVYHAQFHPDGRRVVTAGADGVAQVWKIETGERAMEPIRHDRAVHVASFSPDGKKLITGSDDHTAIAWDAADGRPLAMPMRCRSSINWLVMTPDGRRVATGSDDNTGRVWSAVSGEPLTPMLRHNGAVNAVSFSRDGLLVATGGNDGAVRVWGLSEIQRPVELPEPVSTPIEARPTTRWVSVDGRRFITTERGHKAQVRDAITNQAIGAPLQHGSAVISAAFSPDGRTVVTGSDDDTARIWDAATGDSLTPPLPHTGTVNFVAFGPEGRVVVTSSNRLARVWDVRTGEPLTPPLPHTGQLKEAVFAEGILRLTAADGSVRSCDLRPDGRPTAELQALAQLLTGCRVSGTSLQPLEPSQLQAAWQVLRQRCPELGPGQ